MPRTAVTYFWYGASGARPPIPFAERLKSPFAVIGSKCSIGKPCGMYMMKRRVGLGPGAAPAMRAIFAAKGAPMPRPNAARKVRRRSCARLLLMRICLRPSTDGHGTWRRRTDAGGRFECRIAMGRPDRDAGNAWTASRYATLVPQNPEIMREHRSARSERTPGPSEPAPRGARPETSRRGPLRFLTDPLPFPYRSFTQGRDLRDRPVG